ncbi:hypothetical protein [uncultured Duncaniella sp.]|uniref:hypothetical protein n=1 Tax=uncultured Duncaniella sp. TaxID=2768039 RepID=UPI0026382819|nr:hypothetical protein [uncultured Duncaniella sp.]
MALHRHVARAVVGVVVVEANREIPLELLGAFVAHHLLAVHGEEGLERELHEVAGDLGHDADLHGDQVEDPRAVAHLGGKVAELLDERAAPHPLEIHGLGAEGIRSHGGEDRLQRRHRYELEVARLVGGHVIVHGAVAEELPTQVHSHLEIGVVAAADYLVGRTRVLLSQVHVLSPADAQYRLLGRDIEIEAQVEQPVVLRDEASVSADNSHPALFGTSEVLHPLAESLYLLRIQQSLVAILEYLAVEERGILLPVPFEAAVDHGVDLLLAPEVVEIVDLFGDDTLCSQLLGKEVDHLGPFGGGVAVHRHYDVPAAGGVLSLLYDGGKMFCTVEGSEYHSLRSFCGDGGTVHRTRIIVRERIVHETHEYRLFMLVLFVLLV